MAMPKPSSPLERCNAVLRAFEAPFRLRQHRRSQWVSVYEILPALHQGALAAGLPSRRYHGSGATLRSPALRLRARLLLVSGG
jgi:hypothetical protein